MLRSGGRDRYRSKWQRTAALAVMATGGLVATAAGPVAQSADAAPAVISAPNRASSGQMISASEVASYRPCSGNRVSCKGVASWAKYYYNRRADYFSDDCTDFVSFALYAGGGQRMVHKQFSNSSNDHWWYVVGAPRNIVEYWSHSWTVALDLATFFKNNRAHFTEFGRRASSMTNVRPGMVVFAALGGGGFSRIDHSGVVVKVLNRNVMIAQHSVDVIEPLWGTAHDRGWFGKSPHLQHVWIGDPSSLP